MKIKDAIFLAHKNNKAITKRIIFIIIITLIFILIFVPFTFYKTYKKAVDEILNSTPDLRIIEIDSESIDKFSSIKLNNKHIVKILYNNEYYIKYAFMNDIDNANHITVKPNYNFFTPNTVYGTNLKNEYDIICPSKLAFGVFDDKNINDFFDMTKFLNEEIPLTFYKIVYNSLTGREESIPNTYNFRVVGLYDAQKSYSYGTCYISEKTLNSIVDDTRPYNIEDYYYTVSIFVDKYKNVSEITKILDQNNIEYFVSKLDTDFLDVTLKVSLLLVIIFILGSIFILNIYLKIYLKERTKNIILYKALGFEQKDIKKILSFSIFELLIISILYSIIFIFILKYIILFVLKDNVTFLGLNIKISFLPAFLYFAIIYLIFKLVINKNTNRIYSKSLGEIKE